MTVGQSRHVRERRKYKHQCRVEIPNILDLTTAMIYVDEQRFQDMTVGQSRQEEKTLSRREETLRLEPRALLGSYGISAPYKVDVNAPTSLTLLSASMKSGACGLFGQCCGGSTRVEDANDLEVCDARKLIAD